MSLSTLLLLIGLLGAEGQSILASVFPLAANFPAFPDSPSKAHFEINYPGVCKTSGLGPALQPSNFNTFGRGSLDLNNLVSCLEVLTPEECTLASTAPGIGKLKVNIIEGTRDIPKYITNDYSDELFFHFRYPSICIGRLDVINVTKPTFNNTNIAEQIRIQSVSTNLKLTLSLTSAVGSFNLSTPNGTIPQNSTLTFSGSASDIVSALSNLWFIPFTPYNGSVQYISVTLTDDVQTLSTVLSIPVGIAIVIVDTPTGDSDLVVGSSNGSSSDWYSFQSGGSVSDYSSALLQQLLNKISRYTRVATNSLEIGSIQPGSVVVFFRFLGLTTAQINSAIKNFGSNCKADTDNSLGIVCTVETVGKTIFPSTAGTDSSNSNLSAGAIVGIVIGSVAAGVIALCLILFVISRSRKSSPSVNANKYEDKDFGTGYVAPAPVVAPTPTPTPNLIAY